jgi:UDP-N-acetylmuramoyl-L-alanyl-D-glutamate--2,6-diaminopimelate ligase
VVEVSSHALALKRVATVPFAAAVFTNLSHDHLDLHGDEESYFAAKAALFDQLTPGGVAVVNVDDPYGVRLANKWRSRAVTFGVANDGCDFRATDVAATWEGARFTLREGRGAAYELATPLPGAFNVYNCLAAAATARALGVDADAVRRGVAVTAAVPGRLELVPVHDRLQVVVDYAHSPASFAEALAEIRKLGAEYYVVVFGCTGDRDRVKRPIMGELAARAADYVVITSDDPHYEDPAGIAAEITPAVAATGVRYDVELDRARAIRLALAAAPPDRRTVVAVLGKGHEKVQHLAGRDVPFDDVAQIREAAAALGIADAAGRG